MNWPRRVMRKNTAEFLSGQQPMAPLPPAHLDGEKDDHPVVPQASDHPPAIKEPTPQKPTRKPSTKSSAIPAVPLTPASPNDASDDASSSSADDPIRSSEQEDSGPVVPRSHGHTAPRTAAILRHLQPPTPGEGFSDDSDYFPGMQHLHGHHHHGQNGKPKRASSKARQQSKERKAARKMTERGWMEESGMGSGARADALGDGDELSSDVGSAPHGIVVSPTTMEGGAGMPILKEAFKGDMVVAKSEKEGGNDDKELSALSRGKQIAEEDVEKMKDTDRKSMSEVY